ncbi:uncharacterized protein LOC127810140 isoform X2 [Diospyros lotus]|uniref:uncharacterized protein LOC127810140 isoform X2 n=1 Tax=Diospyros lotus TaxID=55363 RepID=UPI002251A3A2|nr:uncharacterized protein LOC127810140 isoform X2 [Diospyros lotus]
MVISWILNSVSKEISASLIFSNSAFDIWTDLKERFQQSSGPRIFQLRRELMNLSQGQLSVSAYFTKLKTIWEELSNFRPMCSCGRCSCGGNKALAEHSHVEYVMSFLIGLNDSYAQVRGQLLLMDPIPPINKVFALVVQEENQRTILNSKVSDPVALAVKHGMVKTDQNKSQKKERAICTHCGFHGHTIDKCYKLHGYPPGYKPKQRFNPSQTNFNAKPNVVSQVSDASHGNPQEIHGFMQYLSPGQYQHLLNLLNSHLTMAKTTESDNSIGQVSGFYFISCFAVF